MHEKQKLNWESILRKKIKRLNEELHEKYNWDKSFCSAEYGDLNRQDDKKRRFVKLTDLDANTDPNDVLHLVQSVQDDTHESRRKYMQ